MLEGGYMSSTCLSKAAERQLYWSGGSGFKSYWIILFFVFRFAPLRSHWISLTKKLGLTMQLDKHIIWKKAALKFKWQDKLVTTRHIMWNIQWSLFDKLQLFLAHLCASGWLQWHPMQPAQVWTPEFFSAPIPRSNNMFAHRWRF